MAKIYCLFFVILFAACSQSEQWEISEIENPSGENSGESYLHVDDQGNIYLSWIDIVKDTLNQLKYAQLKNNEFISPQTIAQGTDWFVNWADFPSITRFPQSDKLLAHWLEKSASGTFDYDVRTSIMSNDGSWSASKVLHNDGVAAEHGFAAFTPYKDKLIATWLDGRHMIADEDSEEDSHGHGSGAMTLRSAQIDADNNISNRVELDNLVCECCQTDIAITQEGPIVVYRNKTHDNIRDIYYTRGVGDDWTIPKAVFEDNWKISGCPVNGPRVDARGNHVAVAWYSGADQLVKVVHSEDNGKTFSEPLIVNESETIGRVDIAYVGDKDFVVSYMEPQGDQSNIKLAKINHHHGKTQLVSIGESSASRSSGFPRVVSTRDEIYVSYTYVDSTYQQVKTKRVTI